MLKDPPDYKAGDEIRIYYDVFNSSCQDLTITVDLVGSISGAKIHNDDKISDPCTEGCVIESENRRYGNAKWDMSKHPNETGEQVVATIKINAPGDFTDTKPDNNSVTSAQSINIVNDPPVVVPAPNPPPAAEPTPPQAPNTPCLLYTSDAADE